MYIYFSNLGADPKTGSKFRETTGGICSDHGDLGNAKRKTAKSYKGAEIFGVEFPPLAPPSGQTGSKFREVAYV